MAELKPLQRRNFTRTFSLLVTEEMKLKLAELKTFHGLNVSDWVREMIQSGIYDFENQEKLKHK